jgi:NADH:ubiquinone oxidoreductase subunit 4 (subunit M)
MEKGYLIPLAIMVIVFGIAPSLVMKNISPTVDHLIKHYKTFQPTMENYAKISVNEDKRAHQ